jgi:AraC-like DNA-binding protein
VLSPGGLAWLDLHEMPDRQFRPRTGPLALTIAPLPNRRRPFLFHGARVRGTRCVWSASTVSGAMLSRGAGVARWPHIADAVHIVARIEAPGGVFDSPSVDVHGVMRVYEQASEISEKFAANTHLFTLNIPRSSTGLDPDSIAAMLNTSFDLSLFQVRVLQSSVPPLLAGAEELASPDNLSGIDRYLAALAGLLLRAGAPQVRNGVDRAEAIRARCDVLINDQLSDVTLTPGMIAVQLNMSLRQLYRAFDGQESPAARIRRKRLERAAQLLASWPVHTHVDRIAAQCGFPSAEYFSRAFRREYGVSPRTYRTTHREADDSGNLRQDLDTLVGGDAPAGTEAS